MELNPEKDLEIDVPNLSDEFRNFPKIMYRYSLIRADTEKQFNIAKAKLKEIRAVTRKRIRAETSGKLTENNLEAEIDVDPVVLEVQRRMIEAEHLSNTWAGAVESLRAKKDVLIQLGSDRRKEM